MSTLLLTHPACIDHDPGTYHPECPARLQAVLEALSENEFNGLERVQAPRAEDKHLMLVHPAAHVEAVMGTIPPAGRHGLDGDTIVSPGSGEAALRAAGAVVAAVDAVCEGRAQNAFCAVRPPGHHAEADAAPWASACSTTWRSARCMRARRMAGARRGHRFRRASRQRHAAHVRARPESVLCLDASMAALSRHGRARASAASATSSTCRCAPSAPAGAFRAAFDARRSCRRSMPSRPSWC